MARFSALAAIVLLLSSVAAAPVAEDRSVAANMKRTFANMKRQFKDSAAIEADDEVVALYRSNPKLLQLMHPSGTGHGATHEEVDGKHYQNFADDDGTDALDVKQQDVADCWLGATMIALSYVDKMWPISRVKLENGSMTSPYADIPLTAPAKWGGKTYNYRIQVSDLEDLYDNEDEKLSTADQHWWPAAFEGAVHFLGEDLGQPNILMDGGWPCDGLTLLTGYEATRLTNDDSSTWTKNLFFQLAKKASTTPILLSTPEKTVNNDLVGNHAYAVIDATMRSNGQMVIALRNPWGVFRWHVLKEIMPDIAYMYYLKDLQTGPPESEESE